MNEFPWVIVGIIVGLVVVGALVLWMLWRRKKGGKPQEPNYRAFLIMGIAFIPAGVIYEVVFFISGTKVFLVLGLAFIAMGLSYLAVGLANRDKWEKNR